MFEPLFLLALSLAPPDEPSPSPVHAVAEPAAEGLDPNYSRLLFGPTGRPLRKGDGYFSSYELFFPGLAYGITDNLSIAGGMSVFPGTGLGGQLVYVSPRVGFELSDKVSVSAGALVAGFPNDGDLDELGIAFAAGTFGSRRRSVTVGLGLADGNLSGGFDPTPILMIGSTATMSKHVAFVTETWLLLGDSFDLSYQPVGLGLRFFGERLSADIGFVFALRSLASGAFLPWVSISYHFGPSQRGR